MAKNQNPKLPNLNTLYMGRSGAGKSQALKQNTEIPSRGVRWIGWDPGHDHTAHRYYDRASFGRALLAGIRSGYGFRIAYSGERSVAHHEWWCDLVYAVLDGNRVTYVIDEEIAGSCLRSGTAPPKFQRLLNEGRKYGMRYHGTSQRPQEVPKTIYEQCEILKVGRVKRHTASYLAPEIDRPASDLVNLEPLEFYELDPRVSLSPRLVKYKYKP